MNEDVVGERLKLAGWARGHCGRKQRGGVGCC